jgi:hypothetical protein
LAAPAAKVPTAMAVRKSRFLIFFPFQKQKALTVT